MTATSLFILAIIGLLAMTLISKVIDFIIDLIKNTGNVIIMFCILILIYLFIMLL